MAEVTFDELKELIGEVIDLTDTKADEEAVIGEDVAVDSQDMLRILSRIESKYEFRFTVPDIAGMMTLGDLLEIVQQKIDELPKKE